MELKITKLKECIVDLGLEIAKLNKELKEYQHFVDVVMTGTDDVGDDMKMSWSVGNLRKVLPSTYKRNPTEEKK